MSKTYFGQGNIARIYSNIGYVAKIYAGTEEIYNGMMTIRIEKGDYVTKFYKSGTSTDLSSIDIPKESKVYRDANGYIYIVRPDNSTQTYHYSLETQTAQWTYHYAIPYIYDNNDTLITSVPTSSATAYVLQDGYKLKLIGNRSLNQYNLFVQKAGSGVGTINPDRYSVYYGSTVNPTANGSIGSGYAKFTITPPAEAPSQTVTTVNIPITVLASGDSNFGYYYYTYSWNKTSFTMTAATSIIITGAQTQRSYTVNVTASSNLHLLDRSGSTAVTVDSRSYSNISAYDTVEFRNVSGGGDPSWVVSEVGNGTVTRDSDDTPNMYGFDTWSLTTDSGPVELGVLFQSNASSVLNVNANRKIVWTYVSCSVNQANPTYVNGTGGSGEASNSPATPSWSIPLWGGSGNTTKIYVECEIGYYVYNGSGSIGKQMNDPSSHEGYAGEEFSHRHSIFTVGSCSFSQLVFNSSGNASLKGTVSCISTKATCIVVKVTGIYYKA